MVGTEQSASAQLVPFRVTVPSQIHSWPEVVVCVRNLGAVSVMWLDRGHVLIEASSHVAPGAPAVRWENLRREFWLSATQTAPGEPWQFHSEGRYPLRDPSERMDLEERYAVPSWRSDIGIDPVPLVVLSAFVGAIEAAVAADPLLPHLGAQYEALRRLSEAEVRAEDARLAAREVARAQGVAEERVVDAGLGVLAAEEAVLEAVEAVRSVTAALVECRRSLVLATAAG